MKWELYTNGGILYNKLHKELMHMSDSLRRLSAEYQKELKDIYGIYLKKAVPYGSCARGGNQKGSDIDIMIFTDLADEENAGYRRKLSDCTYDFNDANNVEIMPIVVNENHFNYWKNAYVFFMNVEKEGIVLE